MATISSDELVEWAAYYQLDPFGSYRDDLRAGIITSNLLRPHMKKGATPLKPTDFVPEFGQPKQKPAMSAEEMKQILRASFGRNLHG